MFGKNESQRINYSNIYKRLGLWLKSKIKNKYIIHVLEEQYSKYTNKYTFIGMYNSFEENLFYIKYKKIDSNKKESFFVKRKPEKKVG